jgi:hypothetical protein
MRWVCMRAKLGSMRVRSKAPKAKPKTSARQANLRLRLRVHFDKSAFRSRAIPAVIYLSGCGSVDDGVNRITQKAVIERFKSKGVATLIVDPFPARRNARPVRRSRRPSKGDEGPPSISCATAMTRWRQRKYSRRYAILMESIYPCTAIHSARLGL